MEIFMLILLTGLAMFGVFAAKQEYKHTPGNKHWPVRIFLSPGLYLCLLEDRMRSKGKLTSAARYFSKEERETLYVKRSAAWSLAYILLAFGVMVSLGVAVSNREKTHLTSVERPAFGEDKKIEINVQGLSKEESIRINVLSRMPEEAELEAIFDQVFQTVMQEALGGNPSFSEICQDLTLPEETDEGIEITYMSSDPEIISSRGIIMAEEIPEEGLKATLSVCLHYEGREKTYTQELIIMPEEEVLSDREKLIRLIDAVNENERDQEVLTLPDSMEEQSLVYETKQTSPWIFLMFAGAAAAAAVIVPQEKRKEEEKQREQALTMAYPGLVSRLGTLIMANLSIRSAWERIIRDKQKEKQKNEPLTQEMMITWLQLNQGMPEGDAYADLGRRTGLRSYQRLGNLLKNNLRQGVSGLEAALKKELEQALAERKNTALILGEKAGTKLLLPMMLMLLVIIVTLVIPAFFAF